MAKIKCNHCKSKFVYESGGSRSPNFDEVHLEAELGLKELNGKHYCKECRRQFCEYIIDEELILKKAGRISRQAKRPKEPDNIVVHTNLGIVSLLEKLRLVKKVKRTSDLLTPTKKL